VFVTRFPLPVDRQSSCLPSKTLPVLYHGSGDLRKWLIEHPKLYLFFVMFDKTRMNKGFRDENGGHCQ